MQFLYVTSVLRTFLGSESLIHTIYVQPKQDKVVGTTILIVAMKGLSVSLLMPNFNELVCDNYVFMSLSCDSKAVASYLIILILLTKNMVYLIPQKAIHPINRIIIIGFGQQSIS